MNYVEVEFKLDPLLPAREVLVYELGELGYESFVNTHEGIKAYVVENQFDENDFDGLMSLNIPALHYTYKSRVIEQRNWNEQWEQDFDPIDVNGKCLIRAPFHDKPPDGVMDVLIAPKMSFGTGHHQTTFMMAQKLLELDVMHKQVLDMGCGTAVLAIIAKKMGADTVWAVDIEDFAYENARENVKLNGVDEVIVYKGGAELLNSFNFHLILANINRNILLADIQAYVNVLEPGGRICLSGFYTTDFEVLDQFATDLGLVFEDKKEKEGWALLSYLKN